MTSKFNSITNEGCLPIGLKISRIVVVPKTNNPTSPSETRPNCIQPNYTKLYEKCSLPQLTQYTKENMLVSISQFGFRKRHSTVHALLAISKFIYNALDKNHIVILVSLDFEKAFDTVPRDILTEKLRWYGIDCDILNNLLNERFQYVETDSEFRKRGSNTKETTRGIVQRS